MRCFQNRNNVKVGNIFSKYLPAILVSIFSIIFVAGCSDNNTPVDNNHGSTSKIQGRVTDNSGFQKVNGTESSVQGATVILARVSVDGSLETVSNANVQTDANGHFIAETNVDGESNLVVIATKSSSEWKAVVSATVKNGITVYAPPLNDETTVEAEVYANIKASGNANVTFADIASIINSDIAAQVKGNATAIVLLATSINAEADAKVKTFTSAEVGGTQSEWQAIVNVRAQVQAQLERDLFVATNQSDIDAAFEFYANATIVAYQNAGLDVSACGKVYEAASRVLINSAASINASVKFAIQKRIALVKAKIINFIIQAKFTAMGAAQVQMTVLVTAAVTLNDSIKIATTFSEIITAFDNYHTAVINELKITLGTNGTSITTIESDIAGMKATLESSVSFSVSSDVVVNAYIMFYASVKTTVESILTAASQVQVNATTQILILLNAQF